MLSNWSPSSIRTSIAVPSGLAIWESIVSPHLMFAVSFLASLGAQMLVSGFGPTFRAGMRYGQIWRRIPAVLASAGLLSIPRYSVFSQVGGGVRGSIVGKC